MKKKLFIMLIALIVLIYPLYHSYYHIDLTCYEINSDKIQADVHIVLLSDLHDHHCMIKDQIITKIKQLSPDLILSVGDMIDDTSCDDISIISFYQSLSSIAPVYVSLGNHEIAYEKEFVLYFIGYFVLRVERPNRLVRSKCSTRSGFGVYPYYFGWRLCLYADSEEC